MRGALFLLACLYSASVLTAEASNNDPTVTSVETLTVDNVQQLLRGWSLDNSFSKLFLDSQVDGFALSLLDFDGESLCEAGTWLLPTTPGSTSSPAPLAWKKLCVLLQSTMQSGTVPTSLLEATPPSDSRPLSDSQPTRTGRRLSTSSLLEQLLPNADAFSGVRVNKDEALIQLGADGDIVMARSELAELLVMAQHSIFHGDVTINGSLNIMGNASVDGSSIFGSEDAQCSGVFLNCQDAFEAGCPSGQYSVFPDGFKGSTPFTIFCAMELGIDSNGNAVEPGGWALVYRYGFNYYDDFDASSNYVDPIPDWEDHKNWSGSVNTADSPVSTTPPTDMDTSGALTFSSWRLLGTEWAVVSNINSWVKCQPDVGNLFTLTEGTISCKNVKDATTASTYGCSGRAPTTLKVYGNGVGLNLANHYYYWDQEASSSWPTHDPCGSNNQYQVTNRDDPYGAILVRPRSNPCDSSVGPMESCLAYYEAGYDSGSYLIKPDGVRASMCVYCNMTLEGGGWTLVYRYTFNNYADFDASSNYVSHIPTWENHDNWDSSYDLEALESQVAPRTEDEFGALPFQYWKLLGEEFIVASNINSWIRCRPSNESRHTRGSLTTLTEGSLKCTNIQDAPNVGSTGCGGIVPDSLAVGSYGPSLSATSLYYYWDGDGAANWPTHDPCGTNSENQVTGVSHPFGAVYVRKTESPCDSSVGPYASCDDYFELGFSSGSYNVKPHGYYGAPMCVYCEMRNDTESRGGWTMVYRYSFTNYASFTDSSNHVNFIPNWVDHSNWGGSSESNLEGFVSTVTPRSASEYGAMPFELWSLVSNHSQFMVQSNINSWIVCDETSGSFVNAVSGSIECVNIKDSAGAASLSCDGLAPTSISWSSSYGPYLSLTSLFYYWDGEGSTNWPTHDPCGTNVANHDSSVADPYGAVFVR